MKSIRLSIIVLSTLLATSLFPVLISEAKRSKGQVAATADDPPTNNAFPGQNGSIVFTRNSGDSGAEDLFSINADGTGLFRLTNASGMDIDAAVSPDGNRIAWMNGQDVWVMSADGTSKAQLTFDPASDRYPAWSPDGTKILFASDRGRSA